MAGSTGFICGMGLALHLLTLPSPAPARADAPAATDDQAAREAFEAGRAAYEEGRFDEALRSYERSYELSRRPELLYNVGRAAEAEADWSRARVAYEQYLEALPTAENHAFVRARLERVKQVEQAKAPPPPEPTAPAPLPVVTLDAPASVGAPLAQPLPSKNDSAPAKPVWKRGWFWGAAAAVVAGGVVAVIIATRDSTPSRADADLSVNQGLQHR